MENIPELKELPQSIREAIKKNLENMMFKIPIPIITFKEDNWFVATTPAIDVCAQGKNEEEAVKNLVAMIDDYMTDCDTKKPEIKTMINMQIGIKTIPMQFPFCDLGSDLNKQTTSITTR